MAKRTCSIKGCDREYDCRGFCKYHHKQHRRDGSLPRLVPQLTTAERFWAKVDKNGPVCQQLGTQCWVWTTGTDSKGYGDFYLTRHVKAHRWSCEQAMGMFWGFFGGPQVDHKCRTKLCVRPGHLRLATNKQNQENLAGANRNNLSSGIRGVYWDKRSQQWYVKVGHNGQQYHGGCFTDLAEAEQAAINLRNRLFTHNDADRVSA